MIEKGREDDVFKVKAKYSICGFRVIKTIELHRSEVQLFVHYHKDNVGSIMGFNIPILGYLQYDVILHNLENVKDIVDFEFMFLELIKTHVHNLEYDLNKLKLNKQKNE